MASSTADTVFIINGDEMHPHSIPEDLLYAGCNTVYLFGEMKNSERSIINLIREEIFGLKDYVFVVNGVSYPISDSIYKAFNDGEKIYEMLTFFIKEG